MSKPLTHLPHAELCCYCSLELFQQPLYHQYISSLEIQLGAGHLSSR